MMPADEERRGLRLGVEQERRLRAWPKGRIRPKSVALGVISLLAEIDVLRAELAAMTANRDLAVKQERRLRAWPKGRISLKSVALGVISLLAEIDVLRAELAAMTANRDLAVKQAHYHATEFQKWVDLGEHAAQVAAECRAERDALRLALQAVLDRHPEEVSDLSVETTLVLTRPLNESGV